MAIFYCILEVQPRSVTRLRIFGKYIGYTVIWLDKLYNYVIDSSFQVIKYFCENKVQWKASLKFSYFPRDTYMIFSLL